MKDELGRWEEIGNAAVDRPILFLFLLSQQFCHVILTKLRRRK